MNEEAAVSRDLKKELTGLELNEDKEPKTPSRKEKTAKLNQAKARVREAIAAAKTVLRKAEGSIKNAQRKSVRQRASRNPDQEALAKVETLCTQMSKTSEDHAVTLEQASNDIKSLKDEDEVSAFLDILKTQIESFKEFYDKFLLECP